MRTRRIAGRNFRGWCVVDSVVDRVLASGVAPGDWFGAPDAELLKDERGITVKLLKGDGSTPVFAKRFVVRRAWPRVKVLLGREKASRIWRASRAFLDIGVPVPEPLGYVREGCGLWPRASYFFCTALVNARTLKTVAKTRQDFAVWLETVDLLPRLAAALARLHRNGFTHGDTKWTNIMVDEQSGDFWLTDLDAVRSSSFCRKRWMHKDVARFVVAMLEADLDKRQVDAFVAAYAAARGVAPDHVAQSVEPFVIKIAHRHRRQYGP